MITDKPIPTEVVITKFVNGFINGYILENNWITNVEDLDAEKFDLEFLLSVWRAGVSFGQFYRARRQN